jgi:hypothetical protein
MNIYEILEKHGPVLTWEQDFTKIAVLNKTSGMIETFVFREGVYKFWNSYHPPQNRNVTYQDVLERAETVLRWL